ISSHGTAIKVMPAPTTNRKLPVKISRAFGSDQIVTIFKSIAREGVQGVAGVQERLGGEPLWRVDLTTSQYSSLRVYGRKIWQTGGSRERLNARHRSVACMNPFWTHNKHHAG